MSTPLEIAEAALEKVHAAEVHVGEAAPVEPVTPSEESDVPSVYLGHIGEPAVQGKDFE